MWHLSHKGHERSEESKIEIDKKRIENGLNTLFKSKDGKRIELEVE